MVEKDVELHIRIPDVYRQETSVHSVVRSVVVGPAGHGGYVYRHAVVVRVDNDLCTVEELNAESSMGGQERCVYHEGTSAYWSQ